MRLAAPTSCVDDRRCAPALGMASGGSSLEWRWGARRSEVSHTAVGFVHRGILSLSKERRGRIESGRNGSCRTRVETLKANDQRPRTMQQHRRQAIAPKAAEQDTSMVARSAMMTLSSKPECEESTHNPS